MNDIRAFNDAMQFVRQVAILRKDEWIELLVRADGRVDIRGIRGVQGNFQTWKRETDLLPGGRLPTPGQSMAELAAPGPVSIDRDRER
jgi:hypothetical protein